MHVVVVGHVEWVEFFRVDRAPRPGDILHAPSSWEEPAGGGGVAAVELARMAGRCVLHTGRGSDERGDRLAAAMAPYHVDVRGPRRPGPHRRGLTLTDPAGERTIVVVGESQVCDTLAPDVFDGVDAVYFCKGDAATLRAARRARVLVATARVLDVVREAGVRLDALVASSVDPAERYVAGELPVAPALVAITAGASGGAYETASVRGRWAPTEVPGPVADAYGCGDSFAAGLTFALAEGRSVQAALAFAAGRGALALTRPGALGSRGRPPGA